MSLQILILLALLQGIPFSEIFYKNEPIEMVYQISKNQPENSIIIPANSQLFDPIHLSQKDKDFLVETYSKYKMNEDKIIFSHLFITAEKNKQTDELIYYFSLVFKTQANKTYYLLTPFSLNPDILKYGFILFFDTYKNVLAVKEANDCLNCFLSKNSKDLEDFWDKDHWETLTIDSYSPFKAYLLPGILTVRSINLKNRTSESIYHHPADQVPNLSVPAGVAYFKDNKFYLLRY